MKKPAIPAVPGSLPADNFTLLQSMKENIEIMGGIRSATIKALPTTASLADVIVTVNQLIDRLTPGA